MKKVLILPYFGKFNNYFRLWLYSCRNNPDIDWLIITDIDIKETLPDNVKLVKKSLSEIKKSFEFKLGLKLNLEKPYKLCDYKPFYGFLFSEYLEGYDFWGYCDCDLIFGNISHFLSNEIFEKYDKIMRTGHLSFIRNKKEINELFFKYDTYRITLTTPVIYGYDESVYGYHLGFAGEMLENGYSFYQNDGIVADVDFRYFPFYVVSEPKTPCIFSYEDGVTYRIDRTNDGYVKREVMYVHLQKRKMELMDEIAAEKYLICPNRFQEYNENQLLRDEFWKSNFENRNDYFDFKAERFESKKRDFWRLFYEPHKLDCIKYRLKGVRRA